MQPLNSSSSSLSRSSDSLYRDVQLPPLSPHSHRHVSPLPSHHMQQHHPESSYTNPMTSTDSQQAKIRKPRACDLCRRKKIRCDYDPMLPDNQCSSCRGYKKTCAFAEVAKKRGPPKGYVEGLETRLHRMEQLLMNMASSSNISTETIRQYINNSTDQTAPNNDDSSDALPDSRPSSSRQSPSSVTVPTPTTAEPPSAGMKRPCQADVSRQLHDAQFKQQLENVKEGKYSYLGSSSGVYMLNRLFPSNYKDRSEDDGGPTPEAVMHGNEDDLMVARFGSKSARLNVGPGVNWSDRTSSPPFSSSSSPSSSSATCVSSSKWRLPPKPVIDRLVELYFTEMNNYLPIVDEDEFMDKYRTETMGDENGGVSRALLMTICRTTLRILPADDPVVTAYNIDRAAMFRDMVQQLETNYELDFMEPQIEAIQNLLLNSANADGWGPKSANWLATSIAVKMAQDLGLHRSNTQWTLPAKRIEARKRLWWSAYVVDRWVCASLGRPLTVNDADCDLEYPEVGDNDKYKAFVSIIKLSGVLGDVLRAVCSPRARTLGDQGLGPDRISNQLQQALIDWKLDLPSNLWLSDIEMERIHRQDIPVELETKINSGAGQLRILYIAVQLLSKRPSIILGSDQASPQSPKTIVAPQECLDAVENVLDLFYTIKFSSLMFVGWSLTSYGLSQTLLFIFLNHRNESGQVAAKAKRQAQAFRKHYIQLEHHFVETKLITFLDCITKMIQRDEDAASCPSPSSQKRKHDSAFPSGSLWGASSGMDWHDIMDLISD